MKYIIYPRCNYFTVVTFSAGSQLKGARRTQFVADKMTLYVSIWPPNRRTVISIIALNFGRKYCRYNEAWTA